jgi:hypothetical protein
VPSRQIYRREEEQEEEGKDGEKRDGEEMMMMRRSGRSQGLGNKVNSGTLRLCEFMCAKEKKNVCVVGQRLRASHHPSPLVSTVAKNEAWSRETGPGKGAWVDRRWHDWGGGLVDAFSFS